MLLMYVCSCTVSMRLIPSVLQLSKAPSKSTGGHLKSQVEGITKQHNVQIQEAFTMVLFHTACSLSLINAREVRTKEQVYKDS